MLQRARSTPIPALTRGSSCSAADRRWLRPSFSSGMGRQSITPPISTYTQNRPGGVFHRGHALTWRLQIWTLPDPPLTALGIQQSRDLEEHLRKELPIADEVELIVVSPLTRTIQTAQGCLAWLIERGVPVKMDADWQENSSSPCDTGSPREVVAKKFPHFDFSELHSEYPKKTGQFAFTQEAVQARGVRVRQWLQARPEKVIAVVSHSAFLRIGVSQRRYANADYRVFDFTGAGDEIVAWPQTDAGGMGRSPAGMVYGEPDDFPAIVTEENDEEPAAEGEVVEESPPPR